MVAGTSPDLRHGGAWDLTVQYGWLVNGSVSTLRFGVSCGRASGSLGRSSRPEARAGVGRGRGLLRRRPARRLSSARGSGDLPAAGEGRCAAAAGGAALGGAWNVGLGAGAAGTGG